MATNEQPKPVTHLHRFGQPGASVAATAWSVNWEYWSDIERNKNAGDES